MAAGEGKKEIRGVIPKDLHRLVKALIGVKNGGKDWNFSDALTDALQNWVELPENKELIKKHHFKD